MKFIAVGLLGFVVAAVNADSRVSVIELGRGGAVHHTTSKDPVTSARGVSSFWNALHGGKNRGRYLQHAGMAVVPDLFTQPDDGVVISLSSNNKIQLDSSMPTVANLRRSDGKHDGVVGHMDVYGLNTADDILKEFSKKVVGAAVDSVVEDADAATFFSVAKKHATEARDGHFLSCVKVHVDDNTAAATIDMQLGELLQTLERDAVQAGKTIVVHLITEEDPQEEDKKTGPSHRRLEDEDQEDNEDADDADENNGNNYNQYNGFYGVGYYNSYGEWVTPYKSMFQIQYFNVVLWTSIGLTIVLFYTISMMLNMPLMPDTLLFGESAKLVGED